MNFSAWVIPLIFLGVAALGAACYVRRQKPEDRARHSVVAAPHDTSAPLSIANLPQGSRLGAHSGRAAAILPDGSVVTGPEARTRIFPDLAAYREYVGDTKALAFTDQPA